MYRACTKPELSTEMSSMTKDKWITHFRGQLLHDILQYGLDRRDFFLVRGVNNEDDSLYQASRRIYPLSTRQKWRQQQPNKS